MNAGRAKWVPSYIVSSLMAENTFNLVKIREWRGSEEDFTKRLIDLPFQMNMGAVSVPADGAKSPSS